MSAVVKSVLAELIDTTSDDIGIIGHLIENERGTELTEFQDAALVEYRAVSQPHSTCLGQPDASLRRSHVRPLLSPV